MERKVCTRCAITKDINRFHKNKAKKDGLSTWCKLCNNSPSFKEALEKQ